MDNIQKIEKDINKTLLKIIIWFSFLLDSKDEIINFCKKQSIQIYKHLILQYQKLKKYYISFKYRHQEYTKK
jgi:hypothetical protein